MRCFLCGCTEADSSGRCYNCVEREYRKIEMEMIDKRSMWKIRDIQAAKAAKEIE